MAAELQRMPAPQRRRGQAGMSLIEVLVALVIFSIGLLGMVGLQARATQFSLDAEDRTRAALLANELIGQMWAYQTTTLSSDVIEAWQTRLSDTKTVGLPNASGEVSDPDASGVVTITITWRSPAKHESDPSSSYITKAVLP